MEQIIRGLCITAMDALTDIQTRQDYAIGLEGKVKTDAFVQTKAKKADVSIQTEADEADGGGAGKIFERRSSLINAKIGGLRKELLDKIGGEHWSLYRSLHAHHWGERRNSSC